MPLETICEMAELGHSFMLSKPCMNIKAKSLISNCEFSSAFESALSENELISCDFET